MSGFRILSPLGVGGAGAVYLAEHPLLGRRVAVKILHPKRAQSTEAVGRFVAELRAAQALQHPGIVKVHEMTTVHTAAGELPCIVMDLLDGQTLAEVMEDLRPLAPVRAVVIAEQLAEILAAAHARGLVHRNLKSENVFLLSGSRGLDRVRLLYFGIARLGAHGTPAYLSPEQCLGFSGDEGTDIYALGVLLFEMLAGRTPYRTRRGVAEMVIAHIAAPPPRLSQLRPGVPLALEAIVARALEKDPARRFASMSTFLEALRDPSSYVDAPAPAAPVPVAPEPPPARPAPRRPARAARMAAPLAAAAAATLLALLSVFAAGSRPVPDAPIAALVPRDVSLTVTSCAPGAVVFVDGTEVGPSGSSFVVPAGKPLDLSVRAPRFISHERRFAPAADERIEVVLLPAPTSAPTKPEA